MTISIEIVDNNVLDLLRNLEKMQLIRFLQKPTKKETKEEIPTPPPNRFRGALKLSEQEYQNMQQQFKEMRDEWER